MPSIISLSTTSHARTGQLDASPVCGNHGVADVQWRSIIVRIHSSARMIRARAFQPSIDKNIQNLKPNLNLPRGHLKSPVPAAAIISLDRNRSVAWTCIYNQERMQEFRFYHSLSMTFSFSLKICCPCPVTLSLIASLSLISLPPSAVTCFRCCSHFPRSQDMQLWPRTEILFAQDQNPYSSIRFSAFLSSLSSVVPFPTCDEPQHFHCQIAFSVATISICAPRLTCRPKRHCPRTGIAE